MTLDRSITIEAITRGVESTIEDLWDQLAECYERDDAAKIPMTVMLVALDGAGQVDVTVTSQMVVNENERPSGWKAERVKAEKRIRLNPAQMSLPGQEAASRQKVRMSCDNNNQKV